MGPPSGAATGDMSSSDESSGLGSFLGTGQAGDAQRQRRQMFQEQLQKMQMMVMQIAQMEPGFAPYARQMIDVSMQGMNEVVGGMPERESSTPYM